MALPGTRDGSLRANAEAKFQNNNLPSKDQAPVFQLQCLLILVTRFVQGSYDGTNIPELDTSRQVVRSFVGHGRVACFLVVIARSIGQGLLAARPPSNGDFVTIAAAVNHGTTDPNRATAACDNISVSTELKMFIS